jgi:hypothetical protein
MGGADDLEMGVGRVAGAQNAASTEAAAGVAPAASTQAALASSELQELSSALAAGEIDPAQAQAQLIESVVQQQLPAGTAPEVVEALRAEVEAMLAEDPTLQALLQP